MGHRWRTSGLIPVSMPGLARSGRGNSGGQAGTCLQLELPEKSEGLYWVLQPTACGVRDCLCQKIE